MNSGTGKKRRNLKRPPFLVRFWRSFGRPSRLHDGYRVGLLIVGVILLDLAFPRQRGPELPTLRVGEIASEDVSATVRYPVMKSADQLEQERAEAAASVTPVFDHRPEIADEAFAAARQFLNAVGAAAEAAPDDAQRLQDVRSVLERHRIAVSENWLTLLVSAELREQLAIAIESAFANLLRPGAVRVADLTGAVGIVLRSADGERVVPRDSVQTMQRFFSRAVARAPARFGLQEIRLYQNLVIRFSDPTIVLNQEATQALRDQARQAVDPVKYVVLPEERIVSANERVGRAEVEKLEALRAALTESEGGLAWDLDPGGLLYNLLVLLFFGLILKYFKPEIFDSNRALGLLWVLVMVVTGTAALIAWTAAPEHLVPVAFAALVLASLYDGLYALITVLAIVGLIVIRPPFDGVAAAFPAMLAGCVAALSGQWVRRRAHMWTFATALAGAYIVSALSLVLLGRSGIEASLAIAFWGTVNAIGCALLAWGVLPLAESFTRIMTDQTLLELADLNRPLLRRLSLEAPGTYAHSINVANLAEAAAREIGANSLLVRVGVYYHDIGKVEKPQYFVENQPRGRNPHDKLKPGMSAGIVREHVKEGLELAEEARLPIQVKAFISEHHGTQAIGFFLEKAREQNPGAALDERDFRYPGPKPTSRETAIVLLADSVESAARTLQDPTEEAIHALVDRIVKGKMEDGQLGDTPLTLREITVIKAQFVKVLASMYHSRIDYPGQDHNVIPSEMTEEPAAP